MKIETKISIGDIVLLFSDPKWRTVCTAITVRASGQVEYLLEWTSDGELKEEWITSERLECLSKISGRVSAPGFNNDALDEASEAQIKPMKLSYGALQ